MDTYTITIASNDDKGATTTLVVDTSGGNTRITDVHLRAAQGLSSNQIPNIDLALLLQAVTAIAPDKALTGAAAGQAPAPVVETTASSASDDEQDLSTVAEPEAAEDEPAAPVATRARRRRSAPETDSSVAAKRPAPSRRGRKASRGAAAKAAAEPAQAGSDAALDSGGRIYRRAPADLPTVYAELGSASAVAQHYEVPRHTAQGWLRRLRNAS